MKEINLELSVRGKKCSIKGLMDESGRINYTSINQGELFWEINSCNFKDFYKQLLEFQNRYKNELYKIKMEIER